MHMYIYIYPKVHEQLYVCARVHMLTCMYMYVYAYTYTYTQRKSYAICKIEYVLCNM